MLAATLLCLLFHTICSVYYITWLFSGVTAKCMQNRDNLTTANQMYQLQLYLKNFCFSILTLISNMRVGCFLKIDPLLFFYAAVTLQLKELYSF